MSVQSRSPLVYTGRLEKLVSDLQTIPGIGRTFQRDFARIGITRVEQLADADADELFEQLRIANAREDHPTSKNYLYVLRMAVYYANGGRDTDKLKWNYWKNPS